MVTNSALADEETEWFDIVTEDCTVIGKEMRSVAHAKGLLHRAVYCLVFNKEGKLLVQRRTPQKKIAPNCWDLSAAEHLHVGESYIEGAKRGLKEELGIDVGVDALQGPLVPTHKRVLVALSGSFVDAEMVQCYRVDNFEGDVQPDGVEVAEVQWVGLEELRAQAEQNPHEYTEWFVEEMQLMGWQKVREPALVPA